ncbi:hypothetical protein L3Q82_009323 [Scortum barcoo]|uniref:Uncharacterized protein n=1 Tax=Scortum barcoo TaxID=214431 RepID=A0ACB8WFW5_9TELE|nr:hypothetical protein L3Q82_009323 [Scortum barcoo]
MLEVIEEARRTLPINISSTYCGAHAVPKGKTVAEATEDILQVQLPRLKERMSAGALRVDNINVFCEQGVFDLGSTRSILQAGKDMGLNINFHGDKLHPMNSAQLGAELGALAISHLEEPRARDMLEAGVIVALGSNFNPNAYCCSMATTQSQLQQKGLRGREELEKRSSDVKQQLRSQQETEVSRVKELQEKLEQEITELKRKDADLKQLSHNRGSQPVSTQLPLTVSTQCHLHGRAPGRRRDPLHGEAHSSCRVSSELLASLSSRLVRMQRAGTTLVECKSGYGLELQTELKMLEVIEEARRTLPPSTSPQPTVGPTRGKTVAEATEDILQVQLPRLKERMSAGALRVDNIDVFCEQGVFDLGSTRSILQAGKDMGLNINFHGDEAPSHELCPELGALAISHLEEVSEGIAAMATAIMAAMLHGPETCWKPGSLWPSAATSTPTPNAYCCSMVSATGEATLRLIPRLYPPFICVVPPQPIVMHLACVNMRMSMPEALAAATINAAYALGRSHTHGSLEVNKHGDLLILNTTR